MDVKSGHYSILYLVWLVSGPLEPPALPRNPDNPGIFDKKDDDDDDDEEEETAVVLVGGLDVADKSTFESIFILFLSSLKKKIRCNPKKDK